ncbi:M50 family metallopeptidase [Halalkalibacter okhensis]|uniref:M50 family peptidase n=1 Tax=Halalkalibacter okhensis TaxID=333138 RepID=A0A0B0IF99_9BACI|nr:M50 family metallopeptidase [Halalkalibacter okhensis]KHF39970.1 hypothetical protein LQ50_11795 [Halalkalibacter okhensis]
MEHLYLYILAAGFSLFVPFLRSAFGPIHTLIHECGHAIASLILSGKVYSISLYRTTEGVAFTASGSWISSVLVTYAGYTFTSIIAIFNFYLISVGQSILLFYMLLGLAFISLILWVRNIYGMIWLFLFIGGCLLLVYFQLRPVMEIVVYFLSCIILVHSTFASFTIFCFSLSNKHSAGDADRLQQLTYIPAFIWGLLFFFQSIGSTYIIFRFII